MASLGSKCLAEFVGTFLLVLTVCCNIGYGDPVWSGVSIGCVLMVAIYTFGKVSGANFNPAVSVTLGITNLLGGPGIPLITMLVYIVSQILGGTTAAFAYSAIFKKDAPSLGHEGFTWWQSGLCEALYTCMLCFVVLNVAAARKYSVVGNDWYGMAIGFVIIAGAYGAGAVSGGCFNPAVAIGLDAASLSQGLYETKSAAGGFSLAWFECLPYAGFELAGAVLAAFLYILVRPADIEDPDIDLTICMKPTLSKLTSEFLGTFALVLTVGLNVLGESKAAAFSIAASLMCGIYALGDVSGAHFNPAVTLACLVNRNIGFGLSLAYMLTQLWAGVVAALVFEVIYYDAKKDTFKTFYLSPAEGSGWLQVGFAEGVFTAILCMTVLAVACNETSKLSTLFGLAIGSCVTVGGFAIGSISGGSLNPAVTIGVASGHLLNEYLADIVKELPNIYHDALFYCGFEFAGALVAAIIMKLTYCPEAKAREHAYVQHYAPLHG
mmetsp:Transcript_160122/g.292360  ORF Transcript_160122/g.292360 Transcript_160122/m.292360 type:complete len:494 (-) Transcript_160122:91-1572(-)